MSVFLLHSNGIKLGLWAVQSVLIKVHGLCKFMVFLFNHLLIFFYNPLNTVRMDDSGTARYGFVSFSRSGKWGQRKAVNPLNPQTKHLIKLDNLTLNRSNFSLQQIKFGGKIFNCQPDFANRLYSCTNSML